MNRTTKMNLVVNGFAVLLGFILIATQKSPAIGGFVAGFGACALNQMATEIKKTKKLKADATAVSPVIGVILMVAITVVLAAIVFVLVSNLAHNTPEAPRIGFSGDAHGNFTVISADVGTPWSDLLLGPGTTCSPTAASLSHQYVQAADVIHCTADHLTVVHRPTNQVIYSH